MCKYWYAVMVNRDDTDWGTGAFNLDEAKDKAMRMESPDAYIAVIDGGYDAEGNPTTDPVCIRTIDMEDF